MSEPFKRIAIFHPYLSYRGGAERKILLLCRALINQGHDVIFITFDVDASKTFKELLPDSKNIRVIKRNVVTILKLFLLKKYHILYVSNYPANIFSIFIRATQKIWICNEVALVRAEEMNWRIPKWKRLIDKWSVSQFNKCIVNSRHSLKQFLKYYTKSAEVVYSGLDVDLLSKLTPIPVKNIGNTDFIFVLTRISQDKNLAFMEDILKFLRAKNLDISVVLAGMGPDQDFVNSLKHRYNSLIYLEHISEGEKKWLFENCKVFPFLPTNEPLGVTIIEALLFDTRIVAFGSGGPKEILEPFPDYLAQDTEEFLSKILSSKKYPSTDTKDWVKKNFSLSSMLEGMDAQATSY